MHEFSVISSIMDVVKAEMKKANAKRVLEINLEVGELSFLSHDALKFGFKVLAEKNKSIAQDALKIEPVKAEVKCTKCDYSGAMKLMDSPLYHTKTPVFECPKCRARVEVIKGRECVVKNIRMEVD